MAMNKSEKEYVENLEIKASLRWTEDVLPDVPPPDYGTNGLVKGFLFNEYGLRVEPACSSSIFHSFGRDDKTTTQNPIALYSSRLLALKAMRHAMEKRFAKELRQVDILINKEVGD